MLVYRSPEHPASPRQLLDALAARLAPSAGPVDHAGWCAALIATGELEAAVVDALCTAHDDVGPVERALRELSLAAGAGMCASWDGDAADAVGSVAALAAAIDHARTVDLPHEVRVRVPEGYAFYGLYPETYLEAARAFHAELVPARVVCIGIRSIGTSLSAVVAAALARAGAAVDGYTVRPRRHPFDRHVRLGPWLEAALRGHDATGAWFAVVDEGPGLSGSSITGTVDALAVLGVPDERIVVFPSWDPDPAGFRSERARARWRAHRRYVASFDDVWLRSGRLAAGFPPGRLTELSGGAWRTLLYDDARDHPAVQPQHERRKFLLAPVDGADAAPSLLLRFAGLGEYGERTARRATRLAAAGFTPPPLGLANGFLATEFVPGVPCAPHEASRALLDTAARYLAYVAREHPVPGSVPWDDLLDMVRVNVGESCGDDWVRHVDALDQFEAVVRAAPLVAIDGRMLAHEWIDTGAGYLKTDALDHHDGHFLPGPADVAWDLAAACVEMAASESDENTFTLAYTAASGDVSIAERLPFYRIAYLAARLGYVTMAASAIPGTADAARFDAAGRRYRARLRQALLVAAGEVRRTLPGARYADIELVIFDADDTLRHTTVAGQPCPRAPDEWALLPGVADALVRIRWGAGGPAVAVASNQDQVAYGHLSERLSRRLLRDMIVEATGYRPAAAALELCPHALDVPCNCRKPGGAMLRRLMRVHGVEPAHTLFVGNAPSDAAAASDAGTRFAWADDFFTYLHTHLHDHHDGAPGDASNLAGSGTR